MKIPHVKTVTTRGIKYRYFGRIDDDGKTVYDTPLPDINDDSFWPTYGALKAGRTRRINKSNTLTIEKFAAQYEASGVFKALSKESQRIYSLTLRKIEKTFKSKTTGYMPAESIERAHVKTFMRNNESNPGAANTFMGVMKALYAWGRDEEIIKADPCREIKKLKTGEHDPWPEALLERALASDDDRVRLATHLLYFTGQRISDVVQMRWSDIVDGHISVTQQKTNTELAVPIHSRLKAELDRTPRKGFYILGKYDGRQIGPQPIRIALKKFAGDFVPHGLRKNAVIALLEAGCSETQVGGITGQSPQMVRHYSKKINRKRLGDAAILKWEKNT